MTYELTPEEQQEMQEYLHQQQLTEQEWEEYLKLCEECEE